MKIALVHDSLIQYGGAERVLEVLCEMFPSAPIYTLLYDPRKMGGKFADCKIITSFLDFSFVCRHHRWFILLMPLAANMLKISSEYDLVIYATAAFGRGVRAPAHAKTLLYCYTPVRYAWDNIVLNSGLESIGVPRIFSFFGRPFWGFLQLFLQIWDRHFSNKHTKILAVSKFIAQKIKKYYGREAVVLYPPVDLKKFYYDSSIKRDKFFLIAGRLVGYKRFDLVIKVFNELRLPLKIVGVGPEENYLRMLAQSPLIEFLGSVSDEDLRKYYATAQALIFPQEEDFGIAAVEAVACGTPVIAYGCGGILEIAQPDLSGVFFSEQTPIALEEAIEQFMIQRWDYLAISRSVVKFSTENFKTRILNVLAL